MKGFGKNLFKKDKKDKEGKHKDKDKDNKHKAADNNNSTSSSSTSFNTSFIGDVKSASQLLSSSSSSSSSSVDGQQPHRRSWSISSKSKDSNNSPAKNSTTTGASDKKTQLENKYFNNGSVEANTSSANAPNRLGLSPVSSPVSSPNNDSRATREQPSASKLNELKQKRMSMIYFSNSELKDMWQSQRRDLEQKEQKQNLKRRLQFMKDMSNNASESNGDDDDINLLSGKKESAYIQQQQQKQQNEVGCSLDMREIYPEKTFEAFGELRNLSRELNVQLPTPEFVVIGKRGHGKSALIESLIGYTVNYVNNDPSNVTGGTSRPIIIHLQYNQKFKNEPHCTVYHYEKLNSSTLTTGAILANNDDLGSSSGGSSRRNSLKPDDATMDDEDAMSTVSTTNVPDGLPRRFISRRGIKVAKTVSAKDVSAEIERLCRQQQQSSPNTINRDPIYLQMDYAYFINMVIIDTPGTTHLDEDDAKSASESDAGNSWNDIIYEYIAPPNRQIIALEETSEWSDIDVINFVKKVDPSFTRTTLVFTKFHSLIKALSADELQRFLQMTPRMARFFFVSLFNTRIRAAIGSNRDQYLRVVKQAYIRDRITLEELDYDTRFAGNIGIFKFRNFIWNKAYLEYQASIPEMLNNIRASARTIEHKLDALSKAPLLQKHQSSTILAGSDGSVPPASSLRMIATEYTTSFLRVLRDVLNGTSVGRPSETGEKLHEELEHGAGPWLDTNYNEVKVDLSNGKIQFAQQNVYGGQQLRRLLHEFSQVCETTQLGELTSDDVATASGVTTGANHAGIYWASSEIVQHKLIPTMRTYLQQLIQRASYIMKRVPALIDRVLQEKAKQPLLKGSTRGMTNDLQRYVFFKSYVTEAFEEFVDTVAQITQKKCTDEFLTTRTIYWSAQMDLKGLEIDVEQPDKSVQLVSEKIFSVTKARMTKGIMMKLYNFFIIPMQNELWSYLHNKLSSLTDSQFEQIFELNAFKQSISNEKLKMKFELESVLNMEMIFMKNSTLFSKAFKFVHQSGELSVNLEKSRQSSKFTYDLNGLKTDKWTDERANFEEQQKQLQASMELKKDELERRKHKRRATIRGAPPAIATTTTTPNPTTTITTTIQHLHSEEELNQMSAKRAERREHKKLSRTNSIDSIVEEADNDEEYCSSELDSIIERLENSNNNDTELNLASVNDQLKVLSVLQVQDFAETLGKNTIVKKVDLSGRGINNVVLNIINMYLKNNTSVESLDLSNNEIDDSAIQSLCQLVETNKKLTSLNLDNTYIQSSGFTTLLQSIEKNKQLKHVQLNQFASQQNLSKLNSIVQK